MDFLTYSSIPCSHWFFQSWEMKVIVDPSAAYVHGILSEQCRLFVWLENNLKCFIRLSLALSYRHVSSNMVPTSATQLLSTWNVVVLNWDVLSVENTHQISKAEYEKRNEKYLVNVFILITCWNNNTLYRSYWVKCS